jgi:hypothetical protein
MPSSSFLDLSATNPILSSAITLDSITRPACLCAIPDSRATLSCSCSILSNSADSDADVLERLALSVLLARFDLAFIATFVSSAATSNSVSFSVNAASNNFRCVSISSFCLSYAKRASFSAASLRASAASTFSSNFFFSPSSRAISSNLWSRHHILVLWVRKVGKGVL